MKSRLLNFFVLSGCFLLVVFVLDWVCPIESMFGIPCPGCGMSSALYHLLKGDLQAAWFFHPGIFLLIPLCGITLIGWIRNAGFVYTKTFKVLFGIGLIGYLLVYVVRMVMIFPQWPMQYVEGNMLQRIWMTIENIK